MHLRSIYSGHMHPARGMCGLQHTERIHTAKTKSPGPFCEPSGPERVPGFVFALCAGKWPARRRPCGAQQFLLGLGQLLEGILPPQGGAFIRAQFQIGKTRPLWHGCTLRRVRSGGRAGGRQGRWSSRCTAYRRYTAPYTQRRALAERTAQMRPLFFNT